MTKPEAVQEQINSLPKTPGVYFFKDKSGSIMYVGKATSLRDRVRSYWASELKRGPAIEQMVGLIHQIDHEQYDSPMEALIAEANYIKRYLPKYNIQFRDDKSYYFVRIDNNDKSDFDRISLVHKNQIMFDEKGVRYFGPYTSSKNLRTALKIIRRIFGYRSCNIMPCKACLQYHIKRCPAPCIGEIDKKDYKRNLNHIVMMLEGKKDRLISQLKRAMERLSKQKKFEEAARVRDQYLALQHLRTSAKISDYDLEIKPNSIAKENVPYRIEGYDVSNLNGKEATVSLVTFLAGKPYKKYYKKFKIKGIAGPNDYAMLQEAVSRRLGHLNIDSEGTQELVDKKTWDFADDESWALPDLMVIDGGRGQLSAVEAVLKEKGLEIPLVGIAKGPKRIKEDLYFSNGANFKDISVIRGVRDEAHRFAVAYHRLLREKGLRESELDDIPGIGPAKKKLLLQKFGSVLAIKEAPVAKLEAELGLKLTKVVLQSLKKEST